MIYNTFTPLIISKCSNIYEHKGVLIMNYKPILLMVLAVMVGLWAYGKFIEGAE